MAVGADCGTCFLVSARSGENNTIKLKSIRDAFLDLDNEPQVKNMLKLSKTDFIEAGEKIYVIGDPAVVLANIFRKESRRPMSRGVLSPGELEAEKVLLVLLETILGKCPASAPEVCFYSVPAAAIDMDMDVIYHGAMFSKLIGQLGYKPVSLNEAAAISYSNAAPENFSSLAISCLTPGQKIITKRGFINIEEIKEGDEVLNKEGKWAVCIPTTREYKGKVYKFTAYGNGSIEITEDHQLWLNRGENWGWIPAKEAKEGDLVCQPWPTYSFDNKTFICYENRTTCSTERQQVTISLSSSVAEIIGYFLGDGCLEYSNSNTSEGCGIGFTFEKNDIKNIERVKYLVSEIFEKDATVYPHGENAVRIKMYSKGFSSWIKNNCYNDSKEKIIPWNISDLSDNTIRFILRGLIESDGWYKDNEVSFSNTSPSLSQFVYLAMLKLGMNPSFHIRDRTLSGKPSIINGRQIYSAKEEIVISSTGVESENLIRWMQNPVRSSKKSYNMGCSVSPIGKIESFDYEGPVYDVSIIDGSDPSFCVPGIAVHNCGAGMINVCLMFQTIIGMSFSLARSGDWIDISAAKSTGTTASRIQAIKERGIDLMDPTKGDPKTLREREAVIVYYKSLILYALDAIRQEFLKKQGTIDLPASIPIILSGGTALAGNFLEFFKTAFETVKDKFPIPVSQIRLAGDCLNAVAQGLLVAALNYDEAHH